MEDVSIYVMICILLLILDHQSEFAELAEEPCVDTSKHGSQFQSGIDTAGDLSVCVCNYECVYKCMCICVCICVCICCS